MGVESYGFNRSGDSFALDAIVSGAPFEYVTGAKKFRIDLNLRMLVVKKLSVIVFMVLVLNGCTEWLTGGDKLYLQSRNGNELIVPPPLTNGNISHYYDLPQQTQDPRISIEPPVVG